MSGEGGGTNPEQLFAVGYAACFREHSVSSDVESEWTSGPFP